MKDLTTLLDRYFDGLSTAGEIMASIAHLEVKGRSQMAAITLDWLNRKTTAERAIARIRHAYNL